MREHLRPTSTPRCPVWGSHLDGGVGVGDDGDEKAEDHVDEERYEGVEVDPAEDPNKAALLVHVLEGGEHVVPVDEGEQALRHRVQRPKLRPEGMSVNISKFFLPHKTAVFSFPTRSSNLFMIRSDDDPATKTVA